MSHLDPCQDGWEEPCFEIASGPNSLIMSARRYLCSELVILTEDVSESTVNLEEIWREGAILEADSQVTTGAKVEIRSRGAHFTGTVTAVEPHAYGWRFEVEFSPSTPWDPEQFQPEHLLALFPPE